MKHATRMGSLIAALLLTSIAANAMAAADAAASPATPAKTAPAKPATPPAAPDAAIEPGNLGPMSEQEYLTRMEAAFNKQDVNADGYLTRSPLLQEATPEQITAMDTDGDGRISKAEFLAYALKNFQARPKYEKNHYAKP
ncbi:MULTISPECIES: EF-hand domain-containing protein [Achromobacter]|uniref:EF-hand domain-containing protein n=1 Tax=Achromobacter TaxID=222 RepID=UPI0006C62FF5|nr:MULTISPECIES: EF-hand domain-containing protein [Achromobacter]MCG2604427.1 EF-hand domain-containing protein [Achromobacter sp.]CUI56199.1 EF hand [Achromobacter sp. 2789STDY5608621]